MINHHTIGTGNTMARPGKVVAPLGGPMFKTISQTTGHDGNNHVAERDAGAIERAIQSVRDLIDRSSNTTQALCGHADRLLGGRDEGENDANCPEAPDAGQIDTLRRLLSLLSMQQAAVELEVIRFEAL